MTMSWNARVVLLTGLALAASAGLSAAVRGADFRMAGRVDLVPSLALAESTTVDFGTVTDASGTITLGLLNDITGDSSSIQAGGTIQSGVFTITGEANRSVSLTISGSTRDGLAISQFTTDQPDLSSVLLGPDGSVALKLGADLTVDEPAAAPGNDQPLSFTFSISYN